MRKITQGGRDNKTRIKLHSVSGHVESTKHPSPARSESFLSGVADDDLKHPHDIMISRQPTLSGTTSGKMSDVYFFFCQNVIQTGIRYLSPLPFLSFHSIPPPLASPSDCRCRCSRGSGNTPPPHPNPPMKPYAHMGAHACIPSCAYARIYIFMDIQCMA